MGYHPRALLRLGVGAPSRRLGMIVTGVAALALLLAACGQTSVASGGGGGDLKLTCATVVAGHGIDVETAQLTCHVTGAAASDTAFSLQYHVTDNSNHFSYTAACAGALHSGAGSCTQSYTAPVPVPLTPASVSGYTTPGHQALGPVTPTVATATLAPGQHL